MSIDLNDPAALQAYLDQILGPAPPEAPGIPTLAPQGLGERILGGFAGAQDLAGQIGFQPHGFGQGLVAGIGSGLGAAGSRVQAQRQKLEQGIAARQAARDEANLKATEDYRKSRAELVGDLSKEQRGAAASRVPVRVPVSKELRATFPELARLPADATISQTELDQLATRAIPKPDKPEKGPRMVTVGDSEIAANPGLGPYRGRSVPEEWTKPVPPPARSVRVPTASERSDLTTHISLLDQVGQIRKAFKPEFVGPASGVVGSVTSRVGGSKQGENVFRARLAGLRNQILKARAGSNLTKDEVKYLLEELPTTINPSENFVDKLNSFEDVLRRMAQTRRDVMSGTGVDLTKIPDLPVSSAPAAPDYQSEYQQYLQGQH